MAEGVETEDQLRGCASSAARRQGYLFSGPLHGDAFASFLADEEPDTRAAVAALMTVVLRYRSP